MKKTKSALMPGRPREFEIEDALDRALQLFWRQGYEGTSLSDLTAAMGISRPSLYAAFGSKANLFRMTLDRYASGPAGYVDEALKEPTARAVVERLLYGSIAIQSDSGTPAGCLLVQGALSCGPATDPIRLALASQRAAGQAALRQRFERAKLDGDLPVSADCDNLARYIVTFVHGMAVQAAGGASAEELRGVVQTLLAGLPF